MFYFSSFIQVFFYIHLHSNSNMPAYIFTRCCISGFERINYFVEKCLSIIVFWQGNSITLLQRWKRLRWKQRPKWYMYRSLMKSTSIILFHTESRSSVMVATLKQPLLQWAVINKYKKVGIEDHAGDTTYATTNILQLNAQRPKRK